MIKKILIKIYLKIINNKKYISFLRNKGVIIGENCDIHKSADFGSEPYLISIGDNVRITQNVKFITHDGGLWVLRNMGIVKKEDVKYGKIVVGNNCNISWNVIIMPGVTIGNNVVIGAGAIVTKDIPDNMVYAGIPAKKIETIEEYGNKVKNQCIPLFSANRKIKEEKLKQIFWGK